MGLNNTLTTVILFDFSKSGDAKQNKPFFCQKAAFVIAESEFHSVK
jgi:hypothetical protein